MAELRMERKRPDIWRWIVLLLVVALLVWAIVELFGGEESTVIEESPVAARMKEAAPPLPFHSPAAELPRGSGAG